MKKFLSTFLISFVVNSAACADGIELLLGDWISPDGFAKQQIARTFDGSLIETRMWFRRDSDWSLVSMGSAYRRPGERIWRGISRTRDMDGIELFESTVEPKTDTTFHLANVAYVADGSIIRTEEEWVFSADDHFSYTVFKFEEGRRVPWMKGEWVRIEDGN